MSKKEVIKLIKEEMGEISALYSLADEDEADYLKGQHEGLLRAWVLILNMED